MSADVAARVESLLAKLPVVEEALSAPDVFSDKAKYKELAQEHAYLCKVNALWKSISGYELAISENKALMAETQDDDFLNEIREDSAKAQVGLEAAQKALEEALVPPDPNDNANTIVEIRAGTGGDEAALFVSDMVRMYERYAAAKGWTLEILSATDNEVGGFKDYTMVLSGASVHRLMQYEGGTHRVQRVPATETQGRIHTSAITVAVLLETEDAGDVEVDEKDLRIDTMRASGAGGQHVNKTDSAVRLTHNPTGIVVYCQQERSQHKNKDLAMRILKAKIAELMKQKADAERAKERNAQVGSGDRSERIRTYNYPQGRVTDHRIGLTKYNLDQVMEGDLDDFTTGLVTFYHQKKLAGEL